MINEVMCRHIRKGLIKEIQEGGNIVEVIASEILRRKMTAKGLGRQLKKEHEEIGFLESLDTSELIAEAEGK